MVVSISSCNELALRQDGSFAEFNSRTKAPTLYLPLPQAKLLERAFSAASAQAGQYRRRPSAEQLHGE
jgi:hypothetical protein